jgi:hypothetical protein
MYVVNCEGISDTLSFSISVGQYIEKQGVPVLSKTKNSFIFKNTDLLKKVLLKLPFYLKPFAKAGG